MGNPDPSGDALFERISLRDALPEVSRVRLEQTIYAEHPDLKPFLQRLEGGKTQQTPETLASIWAIDVNESLGVANKLRDIGFFEKRMANDVPTFWVPFLYREALNMVQGSAAPGQDNSDQMELDL